MSGIIEIVANTSNYVSICIDYFFIILLTYLIYTIFYNAKTLHKKDWTADNLYICALSVKCQLDKQ